MSSVDSGVYVASGVFSRGTPGLIYDHNFAQLLEYNPRASKQLEWAVDGGKVLKEAGGRGDLLDDKACWTFGLGTVG